MTVIRTHADENSRRSESPPTSESRTISAGPNNVARMREPTNDATEVWYMPAELSSLRRFPSPAPQPVETGQRLLTRRRRESAEGGA